MVEKRDSFHTLAVLVADENLNRRRVLRTLLLEFGIRTIVETGTAHETVTVFLHQPFDVLLLDLDLGGATQGLEVLRTVRDQQYSRDPFLPVIVMGHQVAPQTVSRARDTGAHEFLVRPVTTENILRKLQAVTLRPRPFVQGPTYFGPDRRRQRGEPPQGLERRWEPPSAPDAGLPPAPPAR